MMVDIPETCPHCGASQHQGDFNEMVFYECGSWTSMDAADEFERSPGCYALSGRQALRHWWRSEMEDVKLGLRRDGLTPFEHGSYTGQRYILKQIAELYLCNGYDIATGEIGGEE